MSAIPEVFVLQSTAIFYHPQRSGAIAEAEWLRDRLCENGVRVAVGDGWDPELVRALAPDRELIVALGGDGTILHVARLTASFSVPVLGVNLGRVGFLAEMTPGSLRHNVDAILAGDFWIECRSMLDVEWDGAGESRQFLCLNEVAVARGLSARAVHVNVSLNDQEFMTYTADGVLVVTATGSTAYSLAAGGPILHPESSEFMLTPVAPHLHIGRSVVLPQDMRVTLQLSSDRPAIVTVDGCDERTLRPSHRVHVRRSQVTARFARLGPRQYFYATVAARLR